MNTKFWEWPIATYLFLGGLGGGTVFFAMIFVYLIGAPGELLAFPVFLGIVMDALGCMLLIFELGQPFLFYRAFIRKTAVIKWGAVALSVAMVGALLWWIFYWPSEWNCFWYTWTWIRDLGALIAAIGSFCVMVYTGVLLSTMKARPFWNTPAVPVLFTVSALSTGTALVAISLKGSPVDFLFFQKLNLALFQEEYAHVYELCHMFDICLICVELVVLLLLVVLQFASSNVTAKAVARRWVCGETAVMFWVCMIFCGLLIPLYGYLSGILVLSTYVSPILALCGGLLLRFLFVYNNDRRDIAGSSRYFDRLPKKDAEFLHAYWRKEDFQGF